MNALSFAGRVATAWIVAVIAGLVASRVPALGLLLGALSSVYAVPRRSLLSPALLAALAAVFLAAVLPWAALARDPYQAVPALAAWPVASVAWAMLGTAAAVWGRLGRPTPAQSRPSIPASLRLRRLLLVEAGALALLLPISIAGTQVALALAAVTLLVALARGARPRLTTTLDLPVAAVLAAALISTFLSPTPTSPLDVTALRALLAFYVVTRLLAVMVPSDRELGLLVATWAGASALVSALAFAQHWSGFDAVAAVGQRVAVRVLAPESPGHFAGTGTFASRLTFAHATLVTAATLLGLQLAGAARGKRQGWLWATVALEAAGLWSTFARAAWFAVAAVAAAFTWLARRTEERVRSLRGLAVLATAVALLFVLSPGARAWGRAGLRPSDNHDRLFLWARAAQVAIDHPVFGVGFGSYHLVLGPYYDRFDPAFPMRTWAHDMPLSMLCETGPLGLFAFLWLLIEGIGLALGPRRHSGGSPLRRGLSLGGGLATLGFAVIAIFHDVLYDGLVGYNLFFSLGLAAWASCRSTADTEIEMPAGLH